MIEINVQDLLLKSNLPRSEVMEKMKYVKKINPDLAHRKADFLASEEKRIPVRTLVMGGKIVD